LPPVRGILEAVNGDSASVPPPTTQSAATAHAARIGQVLDDFVARQRRGEPVDEAAFLAAHADIADHLRPHLALLRTLRAARAPEQDLATAGVLPGDGHFGQLGPYRIEGVLGRGGMGLVLKAYDEQLRRPVALKVLRPDLVGDRAALARFEREARAAAALRHPNIVTVYAVGQDRGLPYIAMEYIDGPSLAEVIRQSAWSTPVAAADVAAPPVPPPPRSHAPTPLVRHIFRELLVALDAAHQAGLIHRDIKPANILLESFQQSAISPQPEQSSDAPPASTPTSLCCSVASSLPSVHLADFGLARMRSCQTQVTLDGSVLGTPDYMSPEQARGDSDIDHRTDLYSAGVVLYEMLTGQTPFHADTPTATIHRILHDEPRDPRKVEAGVDPVLGSLALWLMSRQRDDRPASADGAVRALDSKESFVARRRRSHLGLLVMIVTGLLLAALIVFAVRSLDQRASPTAPASPHDRPATDATAEIDQVALELENPTDGNSKQFVKIWRGRNGAFELIRVPPQYDGNYVNAVALRLGEYSGGFAVALPKAHENAVVFAYDSAQPPREIWRLDARTDAEWPKSSGARWSCKYIRRIELPDWPDSRLAVLEQDLDYDGSLLRIVRPGGPTRADPVLYHIGHLQYVCSLPKLLPDGHDALLVVGNSNAIRQIKDVHGEWLAHYFYVSAVMILDCREIGGIFPSGIPGYPPYPAARPYAYAFLDMPANPKSRLYEGDVPGRFPEPNECAVIVANKVSYTGPPANDDAPCIDVVLQPLGADAEHELILNLNRHLENKQAVVSELDRDSPMVENILKQWHPLVREFQFRTTPVPSSTQP